MKKIQWENLEDVVEIIQEFLNNIEDLDDDEKWPEIREDVISLIMKDYNLKIIPDIFEHQIWKIILDTARHFIFEKWLLRKEDK